MSDNENVKKKKPELLIPAGSPDTFKVAVDYGADAVYIGGDAFGLRAKAKNFSSDEMAAAIAYAHGRNVKVHVTANILAHNGDIAAAETYFKELKELGPDALIIADPGMFMLAGKICPEIERHVSTQANNTNYETFRFWYEQGAKRAVCARELSLKEIKEIREKIPEDMEVEAFVHGAMCISYSGRCLLSSYFTGRDANRGACTHPCRWRYAVMEETRPGEYLPIEENERGTFIFNSKDLCMAEHIPELVDAGIDSFKIEGRMKTALYIAVAARTYRRAIDVYDKEGEEGFKALLPWIRNELSGCNNRRYTTGFYYGRPDHESQIYDESTYVNDAVFLGIIEEVKDGLVRISQKNKFSCGEAIEVMKKDGSDIKAAAVSMYDGDMNSIDSCPHPGQTVWIGLEGDKLPEPGDVIRIKRGTAAE
ncbi:MAG: U32 family peptidase [Lachnospiraceae bacterium]|nr:U32 family peptidase [Lachnospiraceae bacterium]